MLPYLLIALATQEQASLPSTAALITEEALAIEFPEAAKVIEHELANGWRFILLPREGAPVVSFETYVAVGSMDETARRTGVAHMFEHLAFKGSDRIGTLDWEREQPALERVEKARIALELALKAHDSATPDSALSEFSKAQEEAAALVNREEFSRILEEAGGLRSLNASTSADETRFVVSLPSNQIELWCWMEAERFARPVFREFYSEREAILEEHRLRVESSPFGTLLEALQITAFESHPYRNPVIGFPKDIEALNPEIAADFFARHYAPHNRITAIIGKFDPSELIPMLERTCGEEPKETVVHKPVASEGVQNGERRVRVQFEANPLLALAWHIPKLTDPAAPALDIAIRILAQGTSSRLQERLVRTDHSASRIIADTGWPGSRAASLAVLIVVPADGANLAQLESTILEEVARLASDGPSKEELEAAQVSARTKLLRNLQDPAELASVLLEFESKAGDWREAFRRVHRLEAVSAADIKRVLHRWLTAQNMTVATLEAAGSQSE